MSFNLFSMIQLYVCSSLFRYNFTVRLVGKKLALHMSITTTKLGVNPWVLINFFRLGVCCPIPGHVMLFWGATGFSNEEGLTQLALQEMNDLQVLYYFICWSKCLAHLILFFFILLFTCIILLFINFHLHLITSLLKWVKSIIIIQD